MQSNKKIWQNKQPIQWLSLAVVLAILASAVLPATAWASAPGLTIKAFKFEDKNANQVQDAGEGPLAGWKFTLQLPDGTMLQAVSEVDGFAVFSGVAAQLGEYRVTETLLPDWTNTTPLAQSKPRSEADAWSVWMVSFGNQLLVKDYGDLPAAYEITTLAENGARNLPGGMWLGVQGDAELNGQPSPDARQDDQNNMTDEDGVQGVFSAPDFWNNGQGTIQVTVSGAAGCFNAWMDGWNSATGSAGVDYDFADSGEGWSEHAIVNLLLEPGVHTLNFPLPLRATSPEIFARFRLSPLVDGSCGAYDGQDLLRGLQTGGEVEDMQFRFGPTAVELSGFSAEASTQNLLLVLGAIWLIGLALLTLALDMRVRHR